MQLYNNVLVIMFKQILKIDIKKFQAKENMQSCSEFRSISLAKMKSLSKLFLKR